MRNCLTVFALAAFLLPQTGYGDSVDLDLAIHEAATSARKAGHAKILVVVRRDYKSQADDNIDAVLTAVEKRAVESLTQEKLDPVSDAAATKVARKYPARKAMRPSELVRFKGDTEFDAVLSLDYKEVGNKVSLRITMVDAGKVLSTDYVQLSSRPALDEEKPATKKPMPTKKPAEKSKDKKKKRPPMLDGPDPTKLPPPKNGATAYIMKRPEAPRVVRTTNRRIEGQKNTPRPDGGPRPGAGGKAGKDREDSKEPPPKGDSKRAEKDRESTDETQEIRRATVQIGEIGRGILNFASNNIGRRVGNGQCWTLAAEAMRAAGAEPPRGYTYGNRIELQEVQPGDILQFKTARFDEPGYWAIMGSPDHTAVVQSVGRDRIFILHQNFGGKKIVQTFDLNPNNMSSGRMDAWRPVPRQPRANGEFRR